MSRKWSSPKLVNFGKDLKVDGLEDDDSYAYISCRGTVFMSSYFFPNIEKIVHVYLNEFLTEGWWIYAVDKTKEDSDSYKVHFDSDDPIYSIILPHLEELRIDLDADLAINHKFAQNRKLSDLHQGFKAKLNIIRKYDNEDEGSSTPKRIKN